MHADERTFVTSELAGSGGQLTTDPEDFWVDEILPYDPQGHGPHLFIQIEKCGLTTPQAVQRICDALKLPSAQETGYAGMKDRHARTRQWISVPWEQEALPDLSECNAPDLSVLNAIRHAKKLRRGHTAANRFRITIRDVPSEGYERALAVLERLAQTGVPHRFGPQRFGKFNDNDRVALDILQGKSRPPRNRRLRDLYWSALQSRVFNQILETRIQRGLLDQALRGDWMYKHHTGGMFTVDDPATEQPRVNAFEISPTGVLPGKKHRPAQMDAARLENEILNRFDMPPSAWARLGPGTRRPLRYPLDPEVHLEALTLDAFRLDVTLPSGAYATVLLDEIVKPTTGPFTRTEAAPEDAGKSAS